MEESQRRWGICPVCHEIGALEIQGRETHSVYVWKCKHTHTNYHCHLASGKLPFHHSAGTSSSCVSGNPQRCENSRRNLQKWGKGLPWTGGEKKNTSSLGGSQHAFQPFSKRNPCPCSKTGSSCRTLSFPDNSGGLGNICLSQHCSNQPHKETTNSGIVSALQCFLLCQEVATVGMCLAFHRTGSACQPAGHVMQQQIAPRSPQSILCRDSRDGKRKHNTP